MSGSASFDIGNTSSYSHVFYSRHVQVPYVPILLTNRDMRALREYTEAKDERDRMRRAFRLGQSRRQAGRAVNYPDSLALLPPFSEWLHEHVQALQRSEFPLHERLLQISTAPSAAAESHEYMWAYGALFRCLEDESTRPYATFDSGVSTSVSERTVNSIEVGILKKIFRVSFSGWSVVVMKVDWVKQDMVRKDSMGFWTCKLDVRDSRRRVNPYILPANAEQVFFVEDVLTPGWSVVMRHEPRSRRVVGNSEEAFDFNPNSEILSHLERPASYSRGCDTSSREGDIVREVPGGRVAELDANLTIEEDDSHYDDNEYEDEDDIDVRPT